jgi:hypothetical protein
MAGPPERAAGTQLELTRLVGYAAFGWYEPDLDVLDLVFDSLVDIPGGSDDEVRQLRFTGHGCTLDVDVRGHQRLTAELRVSPAGPVVVESRSPDVDRPFAQRLVSFLLRWPGTTRRPVRTAWIML